VVKDPAELEGAANDRGRAELQSQRGPPLTGELIRREQDVENGGVDELGLPSVTRACPISPVHDSSHESRGKASLCMVVAEPLQVRLSARAENVALVRRLVTEHLHSLDCASEACIGAVRLALTEAAGNVVLHAYRDGDQPGEFEVELRPDGERLDLVVRDQGCGPTPNPDSPGIGMGIPLMSSLSDSLEIQGDAGRGTEVRMSFALR